MVANDPKRTSCELKSRSAASKRKESAREINVVFNHDFLEVRALIMMLRR